MITRGNENKLKLIRNDRDDTSFCRKQDFEIEVFLELNEKSIQREYFLHLITVHVTNFKCKFVRTPSGSRTAWYHDT